MRKISYFLALILQLTSSCQGSLINSGIIKLNLNAGRESRIWTATGRNRTTRRISMFASVPGGIYSDLEASQYLTSQIYHDYNDAETKWIGRTNWTFFRAFNVDNRLLRKKKIVLVCEGLDTVSKIYINGVLVGKSKNMFVRYIFDIKFALQIGQNSIQIQFRAPAEYAAEEYFRHIKEYGYPVTPKSLVPEYRGENGGQMIRKMQSSFSWDWGPSYPSSGIWKNIYIEGMDGAVIRDVMIFNTPNKEIPDETSETEWNLKARVYFDVGSENERGILTFRSLDMRNQFIQIPVQLSSSQQDEFQDVGFAIPGNLIKLWWPNGYGQQYLYNFQVIYVSDTVDETSTRTLRVGFRTVNLIQDYVNGTNPAWGREFYFNVNGIKMYSKGSNSIPIHVLPEKITKESTKWLLESAKKLHSNMIRVWGGGMYESDYFYDLTDELGIFIWQDFMFACAMYPATNEFLLNVVDEVNTQVKRLQHHASLALYAANNENEAALKGNWYQTYERFDIYKNDYIKLYVDTIIRNVTSLDPSRECLSSSPTNGIQSKIEGWIAENPGDARWGDIHHYDYYGDTWNSKTFKRRTRFASEYGFQSFPYIGSLAKITNNLNEWTWNSSMAEHRQRHPKGQNEIRALIESHLPYPENFNYTEAFPAMVYMSQIIQSVSQKTQTEFYRRLVDKLANDGSGHNMGALYWQLNDIWPACSWASFEVDGRWKMFAYYIQKAFNPVLPSPYRNYNGDVVIELISDQLQDYSGQMRVRVFSLNSMSPLIDQSTPIQGSFLTSKEVYLIPNYQLENVQCGERQLSAPCLVYLTDDNLPDNFLLLHYPKNKNYIKDPNITVIHHSVSEDFKTFTVTLQTTEIALFVFLNLKDYTNGHFEDNGFILVEPTKTIAYHSRDPMGLDTFISQLDVMSLYDVTMLAR